jgi:hypothetical protein
MSATLTSILLLSVCALALLPIALASWRPRLIAPVGWIYGAMILAVMVYQAGFLPRYLPVTLQADVLETSHLPPARCAELMELLRRQQVLLTGTDQMHLVVNQELWSQLPQEARDAIIECAEAARPEGSRGNAMQVVEQPAH